MGDWGIKISVAGEDVLTADDKDLVYSSKYNGMKILKHNTKAVAGNVAHGLSYIPIFINYIKIGDYYFRAGIASNSNDYVNSTNIVFTQADNYYFIFVDKGE